MLKTHNSAVTYEPHCYLAPSDGCMSTDTRFCMCRKNCINYAEILCSQTTRSLDFVPPCLMRLLNTFTANIITFESLKIFLPLQSKHTTLYDVTSQNLNTLHTSQEKHRTALSSMHCMRGASKVAR